jgi:hypothetical protein
MLMFNLVKVRDPLFFVLRVFNSLDRALFARLVMI